MNNHSTMNESSLVGFTLLVQMSVGMFLCLGLGQLWADGRVGAETARQLTSPGFLAMLPLMAAALLVSLLHLGTPLNAWRSVANLRSSWLSREILFTLLFTLFAALFAVLHWQTWGAGWLRGLVWSLAAVLGGLAWYAMLRIYLLRTVPGWNTWMTPVMYAISLLLLGGLGAGAAWALNPAARGELLRLPLAAVGFRTLALLAVQAVLAVLRARSSQEPWPLVLHMSLLVFALVIATLLAYQALVFEFSGRNAALSLLACAAFLAALAEQAVGRWLFYRM
mgnify:FL=1